eukprot:gb/GFBE01077291.1/.p1 GENE.gb/GFBE01077291.1/~~gb/GFBE01077291.1/.p1  ORF type:complete len:111 (+),score=17.25 gb/GFBE01077291.1/:1-333(+)
MVNCDSSPSWCTVKQGVMSPGTNCWITSKRRRVMKEEVARLHGLRPTAVSSSWTAKDLHHCEPVNVLQRVLVRALPAAGLVPRSELSDGWETGQSLAALVRTRGRGFKQQ